MAAAPQTGALVLEVVLKRFEQPDEVRVFDDGRVVEMRQGDVFHIPPGHDSWVVGDEPYVSLDLIGAGDYARHEP